MVLKKAQISPQYISEREITVTILDVKSPAHFIVKETPTLNAFPEVKGFLEAEKSMQKYYASVEPCFLQLPLKDAIIVVFHEEKFYRAKVIRILTLSTGHLFKVYLVDYGVECSILRNCIYEIEKDFLNHPFQAVNLKLLGIEPISLVMDSTNLSMSYGRVSYWDSSAERFVHDLQKEMCNAYIKVEAIDEQHVYGSLFLCYNDNTVKCVNNQLVSNSFAHFDNSCWENVHKIEDILENEGSTKNSAIQKSSTPEQLNPKQMPFSSEIQSDFKDLITTFIRPSDGKVVAKSSFAKDDAIKSSPQIQENNMKPQENPKAVSPVISGGISPEEKAAAHKRFQKLQMLNRKRHSASSCQSNLQDTVNKSPPTVIENTVLEQNLSSEVSTVKIENNSIGLNSIDNEKTQKDNITSNNGNVNSHKLNCQSSASNKMICAVPENKFRQESVSQAEMVASKRLQKLQSLCRKHRNPLGPNNIQATDGKNTSNEEKNSSNFPSDKTENSSVDSDVYKGENFSDNIINQSKPNVSNDNSKLVDLQLVPRDLDCATAGKNNQKQECLSETQLIGCKKLQKLQLLYRRQLPSPILQSHHQNTVNTNPSTSVCSDKVDTTPIKIKTSERTCNDNNTPSKPVMSDVNVDSDVSSKTIVPNEKACMAAEINPKQENKPGVIAENIRTFKKLQQGVRKKNLKLQSVSTSQKSSNDLLKIEETFQTKCSIDDLPTDNSNLISSNSEQMISSPLKESLSEKSSSPDEKPSSVCLHQGLVDAEKTRAFIEYRKKLTQSLVVTNEPKHNVSRLPQSKTLDIKQQQQQQQQQQQLKSSDEITCTKLKEIKTPCSIKSKSPRGTVEKVKKSPSDNSKSCTEFDDLDISPMQPKQSEILNELLAMSDSDDLLCSISNTNDENFCDSSDIEGNYIELSTQLKHSDPKLIEFTESSLWEKQKVPALLIGKGLISPALNVEEAKFSKYVIQVLKDIKFYGPSCIQSIIWPCMEKNRCMVAVAPPHSGKTVSYVLPLVSFYTDEKERISSDNGPSTIILCSSWLKAQAVYDLFHFFLGERKIKIITLCIDGGHYRNRLSYLANSCDILIATPSCLLQFFKKSLIKFAELQNFILDDSTVLMNKHKQELKNILLSYMYATNKNMVSSQLILFAERWNKHFHMILDKVMKNPLIFFTSFLESALYAKVSIFAHVCEPDGKQLLILDILKEAGKVVICTTNRHDAVDVHHFLRCENTRTFLVNEEMEHYIADEVIKDWKSVKCMTTSHCLVITDKALIKMSISNADCLVHYDIPPESRLQFGNRFSCIAEHFQESNPTCVSHIFITESEYYYAPQIIEIIENSGGIPSEDLIELSKKQNKVENTSGMLCPYLKAFGFCKEHFCKYRHVIDAEKDKPQIVPCEGNIQGLVTHIADASHYYVRLLKYLDPVSNKTVSLISSYAEVGFQLRDFYSSAPEEMKVQSPVVGESYVLAEENNLFYRIKVLKEVNHNSPTALPSWKVLFLDEGWIKHFEKLVLYKLSDEIKLPEPLAVEVYVCNIITPDSCFDWNPQTSQLVSDLIKGKEIQGKIALCLGQTLWLEPMAIVLHLSNTNEYVNLFKLNQKLLEYGHVKQNKNHLVALREACADKIPFPHSAKAIIKRNVKSAKQAPVIYYAFLDCNIVEDVYVSSVISPHQLYVQRAKFVECLDNLLDNINVQVEKRILKKAYPLYKGMHCIAPFHEDDRYYRAMVIDIVSDTEVHLFYVDFGDNAKAPRNNIYCLPPEFLLLPFQAIECELAGISAAHGGWTDSSADALTTLTRDEAGDMKILQLKAYKKTSSYEGGNHYAIDLWFDEKNLSEQLLQAGFGAPAEVPIVEPLNLHCSSSEHSNDEEFNLNERELSSNEDLNVEDKNAATLFYLFVAEMEMQTSNLIPKPGVTITEVSSDDEKCENDSNESNRFRTKKVCNDLVKLISKLNQADKQETSLEPCSSSLRPLITWWDTPEQLSILINLKEVKMYQLAVTDEGFNFSTIIAGIQYSADEKFYDKIHSSDAKKYQTVQGINVVAKKCVSFKWPRFTKEKGKFLHIKYDLIHIDDSDTDELSAKVKKQNMRYEYATNEDSSSTDSDEKYVEPWRDFAQQKGPFNACD